ncbi:pyridoxamine 5'-phosphate oxidase family protein [Pontibacillus marinus]|uniref:pyridoxamine 5'-phosphate oxidase family protein n=1 Tax=Pontibacillus marinus TaxID=273164 RepID=UPI00040DDABB|nr:pyridoxamine 5'-phosphate oxidase family protein [Pontibacillus marinus]
MQPFQHSIQTVEELEKLVGTPSKLASNKVIDFIDENCKEFIALSPFLTLATSAGNGTCDVSPRGDQPGFVYIHDQKHLVIPERPGNKRVDSMRNILENPHIGIIFMIPGTRETLRINGTARLIQDEDILKKMKAKGHTPSLGIAVEVEECFIHCAKAFIRSELWNPNSWLKEDERPKPAKMMAAHAKGLNMDEQKVQSSLDNSYSNRLY